VRGSIRFDVDLADFGRQIQLLANATRRTLRDTVLDQSRLLVRDLIKTTPPHGTRPIQEDWTFQRHKGEKAIALDIRRLFQPLNTIRAVMYPTGMSHHGRNARRLYLQYLADRGDWHGISESLFAMHVTGDRVNIVGAITRASYREEWSRYQKRGRIPKGVVNSMVWDAGSVTLVTREVCLMVGFAKGGWLKAANALHVQRLPAWVTRHEGAPGSFEDLTEDTDKPSFTMTNDVAYIAYLNAGGRLVNRAMRNRQRAMEISTEKAIEYFCRDFAKAA